MAAEVRLSCGLTVETFTLCFSVDHLVLLAQKLFLFGWSGCRSYCSNSRFPCLQFNVMTLGSVGHQKLD